MYKGKPAREKKAIDAVKVTLRYRTNAKGRDLEHDIMLFELGLYCEALKEGVRLAILPNGEYKNAKDESTKNQS